jgi:hypothetical protein
MATDLDETVRASARGWQGVQLAALGFVGLCGVLQQDGSDGNPRWLQVLAGVLVLVALALSCLSTALVALVAWPVGDPRPDSAERRLRVGIGLTFLAVAVLATAATSSWWPQRGAATAVVELATADRVLCGDLVDAGPGVVGLRTGGTTLAVRLEAVQRVRPVTTC